MRYIFYYIFTTNTRIFNFCLPAGEKAPLQHADCCRGDVGKHALELPRHVLHPEGDVCRPAHCAALPPPGVSSLPAEQESKGAEKGRSMSTVEGQQMCSWSWRREWRRSRR